LKKKRRKVLHHVRASLCKKLWSKSGHLQTLEVKMMRIYISHDFAINNTPEVSRYQI